MKTKTTLLPLALSVVLAPPLAADDSTDNITNNTHEDRNPQVSGSLIVWESQIPDDASEPDDFEIMARFGDELRQITDNQGDDINVRVSGTTIVWQSWDGADWEIWTYNADSDMILQLTDNTGDDINPSIDGNTVAWQAFDGADFEIASASVASLVPAEIGVRITPRSLNLRSNGNWVSASIDLGSSGIDPATVDLATIVLEGTIPAEQAKVTGSSIKMKFDRGDLAALLAGSTGEVDLTVTGTTTGGDSLSGTDTIRVIP